MSTDHEFRVGDLVRFSKGAHRTLSGQERKHCAALATAGTVGKVFYVSSGRNITIEMPAVLTYEASTWGMEEGDIELVERPEVTS